MPHPPRDGSPYQQRERRLLAEWLAARYPNDRVQQQVRLGAYQIGISPQGLSSPELRALGVWRRIADALVYKPTELILIEASLPAHPGYVSQLLLYKRLIPMTPELADYAALPVRMIYLVSFEDPVVTAMCRENGIQVEVYAPPWVGEYWAELERRKSRPPKSGGL